MALVGFVLVALIFWLVLRNVIAPGSVEPVPVPSSQGASSLSVGAQALMEARVHDPDSLAGAAAGHGIAFGTAVNSARLSDPAYSALLSSQFSIVTPETAMKWATLEPSQGVFDFGDSDAFVQRASDNGQMVRGHTLVWHRSVPDWVTNGDFDREQMRDILHTYISTVVGHYKGRVAQWDVVNEVMGDDGNLRDSIWLDRIGPSYIDDAFRWAHEADPSAALYMNEVGLETSSRKSDAVMKLIDGLKAHDVPIDGLGYEAHQTDDFDAGAVKTFRASMADAAKRGLVVAVTELDVRVKLRDDGTYDDTKQQAVYRSIMKACVDQPVCKTVVVWGFTDASSWVPERYPGLGGATLYDAAYRPKGARAAVLSALS